MTAAVARHGVPWLVLLQCAVAGPVQAQAARAYHADERDSRILVVTRRSGVLGFLGHEHAIVASRFAGTLCVEPGRLETATLRVEVPAHALVIDGDSARREAGLGRGPSPAAVIDLQRKLLGPGRIAADSFPLLAFRSTAVAAEGDSLRVRGVFEMRGMQQEVAFPARALAADGGRILLSGALRLKQSAFGIRPERIAGVVRVADEVELIVTLAAAATGAACTGASPIGKAVTPE